MIVGKRENASTWCGESVTGCEKRGFVDDSEERGRREGDGGVLSEMEGERGVGTSEGNELERLGTEEEIVGVGLIDRSLIDRGSIMTGLIDRSLINRGLIITGLIDRSLIMIGSIDKRLSDRSLLDSD